MEKHLFFKTFVIVGLMLFALCISACPNKPKDDDDGGIIKEMSGPELVEIMKDPAKLKDYLIVDVRRNDEYPLGHVRYAIQIELNDNFGSNAAKELADRKDKNVILTCRTDKRSQRAAGVLKNLGFKKLFYADGWEKYKYKDLVPELTTQVTNIRAARIAEYAAGGTILDARTKAEFDAGHVEGAVNVPDEAAVTAKLNELNKDLPVVVYSSSPEASLKVAERFFNNAGGKFTKVFNCIEGRK